MVKIFHRPLKELIILECVQYPTVEVLCSDIALVFREKRPFSLSWCDGIVFSYVHQPPTTEWLIKERSEGRIYWSSVIFSLMPDYKSKMKVGKLDVRIIKTSNPLLKQVSNWLKKRAEKVK